MTRWTCTPSAEKNVTPSRPTSAERRMSGIARTSRCRDSARPLRPLNDFRPTALATEHPRGAFLTRERSPEGVPHQRFNGTPNGHFLVASLRAE
jgi:hypothetical protein